MDNGKQRLCSLIAMTIFLTSWSQETMQIAEMLGKLFDQLGEEFLRGLRYGVLAAQEELRSRNNPVRCCTLFCLERFSYFVWHVQELSLSSRCGTANVENHSAFPLRTMSPAQSNFSCKCIPQHQKMHAILVLDVFTLSLANCTTASIPLGRWHKEVAFGK